MYIAAVADYIVIRGKSMLAPSAMMVVFVLDETINLGSTYVLTAGEYLRSYDYG